jgi:ubiquinone/menaquinone biosynthesis C-methylase UbiE
MEQQLEKIRDQQKVNWNKFSAGWKKWENFAMNFLKPVGDEIISMIKPKDGEYILDVAAGTGEPGLTIAAMIPNGKVMITDLAEAMLEVSRENIAKRKIKNAETVACDVCEMPFDDNTFDAISCRMGFMFFPDMLMAAKEMARVLKPGGRVAASVWNVAEKNNWMTTVMDPIKRILQPPPAPPGSPGMVRCAGKGIMTGLFQQAGLNNIAEKELSGQLYFDNPQAYWDFHFEVSAPVVGALSKADDETKNIIKKEVFDSVMKRSANGRIVMDYSSLVICGEKG